MKLAITLLWIAAASFAAAAGANDSPIIGPSAPVTLPIPQAKTPGRAIHVALTGDDSADGSPEKPLRTIQAAAQQAQPGDSVLVHAGVYRETVTPSNSGTAENPITYQPAGDGVVTISGTEVISEWAKEDGNIFAAPLAKDFYPSIFNYSLQIFVGGQMLNQARWPNTPHDKISYPQQATMTKFISKTRDTATNWTTAVFEDEHCPFDTIGKLLVGAQIMVQPNYHGWSWTLTGTVEKTDATESNGTRITIKTRNDGGKDGKQEIYADGSKYFVFDKRELLDSPGEWFQDTASGKLLVWLPGGADPTSGKPVIEARKRDFAFDLDGKSHIVIKDFHLFACTITTDTNVGDGIAYDADGKGRTPWRGTDGKPAEANHIFIDGIQAKYVSHYTDQSGHFIMQFGFNTGIIVGGSDNVIQNCTIQYSAGNGIALFGSRNKALHNAISDVSYNQQDTAGIATHGGAGKSFDQEIAYNTITRTGRTAMTLRNLFNSVPGSGVTRVHHNDLSNFMIQDSDGGGMYTFGIPSGFIRIDHNLVHDGYGSARGIYTDYASQFIIDHNVIWNVHSPLYLLVSSDLVVTNNTLIDIHAGYDYQGFLEGVRDNNKGSAVQNNLAVTIQPTPGPGGESNQFYIGETPQADSNNLKWDGVYGSETDPKFADIVHHDYRLTADSPAFEKGVVLQDYTFTIEGKQIVVKAPNDPTNQAPNIGAWQGSVAAVPEPKTNLAAGKDVTASSSRGDEDFEGSLITDGNVNSEKMAIGWSSEPAAEKPRSEWVQIDLGVRKSFERIDIYPRNDGPKVIWGWDRGNIGRGIPEKLILQASDDPTFTKGVATLVTDDRVYERPHAFAYEFPKTTARYIRITGENLIGYPYKTAENKPQEFTMQLGEVKVFEHAK